LRSNDCVMNVELQKSLRGVEIAAPVLPGYDKILTPDALQFVAALHRKFNFQRQSLLDLRKERQRELDNGEFPHFLDHTWVIREGVWKVAPVPPCLQDRRVEITGPVDRKMIINALNSGAKVFMADFEDSTSPTWQNIIEGQMNLYDAVRKEISFSSADGKDYKLMEDVAVMMVRPRGWHLEEKHLIIDGSPASASLVDFGLYMFHNTDLLSREERGPFFYLPKMENHLEARLWNEVFVHAQQLLHITPGTIKATVLIETIFAAFEMEEILFELREHSAGLNAGRWDYIFSIIKKFRNYDAFLMPDRGNVTMNVPFMKVYAELLVKICHKRGAHAIGGMSAFIPSKDAAVNEKAYQQVRNDKEREASQGYDGTWVAHPKLVGVAREVFDFHLKDKPHQKHVLREDLQVRSADLLNIKSVELWVTEDGVRKNINVALLYIESWLRGTGAAALYNLMEDAATAEISRAQLWQWLHHHVVINTGEPVTVQLLEKLIAEEYASIARDMKETEYLAKARKVLSDLVFNNVFDDFLTIKAYPLLD
jgi:malate synthase